MHPNTHCCHAVLDVLFIYWICARSRSQAFPPALSPTKHAASFSPAYECACHTPAHPGLLPAACRVLGSASLPTTFFLSLGVFLGLFPPFFSSVSPCISPQHVFAPFISACFSTFLSFSLVFCPYSWCPSLSFTSFSALPTLACSFPSQMSPS